MYFTTCTHCVKSDNLENLTRPNQIYEGEERACPLCKNPNNLAIPVIPGYPTKIAELDSENSNVDLDSILTAIFDSEMESDLLRTETANTETMRQFYKSVQEPINNLRDNAMISCMNYTDLIELVKNRLPPTQSAKKLGFESDVIETISQSTVYVVDMIKLLGLPHFILKIAPFFQNMFKALRLMAYDEISTENK
jgi:hypothetical protein